MSKLTRLYARMLECFMDGTRDDYLRAERRYARALRRAKGG